MNNEPNKPAELTEKELEGIAGGMTETASIEALRTSTGVAAEGSGRRIVGEFR